MQNSWIRELSVDYLAVMPAGHEQPDEVFSSVVCDTVEHIGSVGIISCRQFPVIRVGPRRRNVGSGEMSGTGKLPFPLLNYCLRGLHQRYQRRNKAGPSDM